VAEARTKVSPSQAKILGQLQQAAQTAQVNLNVFLLAILAGVGVENFLGAKLDGEELVYTVPDPPKGPELVKE
jgi:hypothetical protein